mmetsp:Transcript_14934/g.35163  ORF Transcript_14934/g.35163 Transcript_14934/m.35163 type:complete len:269 (-) Transcript_14934:226-1032(-)
MIKGRSSGDSDWPLESTARRHHTAAPGARSLRPSGRRSTVTVPPSWVVMMLLAGSEGCGEIVVDLMLGMLLFTSTCTHALGQSRTRSAEQPQTPRAARIVLVQVPRNHRKRHRSFRRHVPAPDVLDEEGARDAGHVHQPPEVEPARTPPHHPSIAIPAAHASVARKLMLRTPECMLDRTSVRTGQCIGRERERARRTSLGANDDVVVVVDVAAVGEVVSFAALVPLLPASAEAEHHVRALHKLCPRRFSSGCATSRFPVQWSSPHPCW